MSEWFEIVRRWCYIDNLQAQAFDIDASGNPIQPDPATQASATQTAAEGEAAATTDGETGENGDSTAATASSSGDSESGSSTGYVPP